MSKVLVLNPVVGSASGPNEALWYAEPYFQQVYDYVKGRVETIYLYERGCVRGEWARALAQSPMRIGGVGHGNERAFAGYRNEVLVQVGSPDDYVPRPGCEVFLLSCRTAAELGPWLVREKGVAGYLGWRTDYSFWAVWGVRKRENSIDYLFLKPVEDAVKRWLAGEWTLEQAYKHVYDDYMAKAGDQSLPPDMRATFYANAQYLTLIRGGAARTLQYTVRVVLPDGAAVESSGSAPYPQPAYTVQVRLPGSGPEGDGKVVVSVSLDGRGGSAEVQVKFKAPSGLAVSITEPKPGATLVYGSQVSVTFTVSEA